MVEARLGASGIGGMDAAAAAAAGVPLDHGPCPMTTTAPN